MLGCLDRNDRTAAPVASALGLAGAAEGGGNRTMVIYDFGSNDGSDIPYYLLRANKVVAVEANPALCEKIRSNFTSDIASGRVVVENVVLDVSATAEEEVPFYVHKTNHVLSQFPEPSNISDFQAVMLRPARPRDVLKRHGDPYYIKIDIEHYDEPVLRDLFDAGYYPKYISAELHSVDVFCTMVALGGYKYFKLLDGRSVSQVYKNVTLSTARGHVSYSFPRHSAGPFGDDIAGPWMTLDQILDVITSERLGWKDLHATLQPDNIAVGEVPLLPQLRRLSKRLLRQFAGRWIWADMRS